ncbi:MAG: hypothetical protein AAB605_00950 [Patescibacteria group bacterium]
MYLTRDGRFVRTDIWREGEYLDLWSVPHFLSGVSTALGLYLLGFAALPSFIIAFLLFVAYEMFETIAQIEETRWNRTLDVVVGMVSFAPAFLLAPLFPQPQVIAVFVVVTAVDTVLSFFGWRASQKAAVLEARLRVEFGKEKEKFVEQKERVQKRWRERKKQRAIGG